MDWIFKGENFEKISKNPYIKSLTLIIYKLYIYKISHFYKPMSIIYKLHIYKISISFLFGIMARCSLFLYIIINQFLCYIKCYCI